MAHSWLRPEDSERRFRLLVEAVSDHAIYMIDRDGRIASWNPGGARIKGYSAEEVLGRHFSIFFCDEDRRAGRPAEALEVAGRTGHYKHEGWMVRKDGSRFWAHSAIDAIRDESGALIGYAKVTRDISERRDAQQRLDEARTQLLQSQKMEAIGQLTGGIAHDFNNLLTVIIGGTDLAERAVGDPERLKRLLGNIRHAARRGEALTRQLLVFARREALKPELIELSHQLPAIADLLRRSLRGDIAIETSYGDDIWPVEVDPSQLELALLNIAVNARDAMPAGGKVTVTARNLTTRDEALGLDGDYVAISVRDEGVGIHPEIQSRVFEPFFTTKGVGKGTGLGLSQAYGFAVQSGGAIALESEVGHGTDVTLYLPAAKTLFGTTGAADAAARSRGMVLLVEDDLAVAELTRGMIEEAGFSVTAVGGAQAALDLVHAGVAVDLVFTDIVMPGGMSGIEFARTLRAERPDLPVVLTTGYTTSRGEAGDFPLVAKPYDQETLTKALEDALGASNRRPL